MLITDRDGWGEKHFMDADIMPVSDNEVNWSFEFAPGEMLGSGQYQAVGRAQEVTRRLSNAERFRFNTSEA
jgi:hypothetical protein